MSILKEELAKMIDYSILRPDTTKQEVIKACQDTKKYHLASICVLPCYVQLAKGILKGTDIKVVSTVGFPFGANTIDTKIFEARNVITNGADEIDIVINICALKSGDIDYIYDELKSLMHTASIAGLTEDGEEIMTKIIIETCYLTKEEKIKVCKIAKEMGADFIKTSTGFGPAGATVEDIKLIREVLGNEIGIKAAGGIKTLQDAIVMIEAGANRIGTSSAIEIMLELNK